MNDIDLTTVYADTMSVVGSAADNGYVVPEGVWDLINTRIVPVVEAQVRTQIAEEIQDYHANILRQTSPYPNTGRDLALEGAVKIARGDS